MKEDSIVRLVLEDENEHIRKRRKKLRQIPRKAELRRTESCQSSAMHEQGRPTKEIIVSDYKAFFVLKK